MLKSFIQWLLATSSTDESARGDIGDPAVADKIASRYNSASPAKKEAMEADYFKRVDAYAKKRAKKK